MYKTEVLLVYLSKLTLEIKYFIILVSVKNVKQRSNSFALANQGVSLRYDSHLFKCNFTLDFHLRRGEFKHSSSFYGSL